MNYSGVPVAALELAVKASQAAQAEFWACDIAESDGQYYILECATAFAAFPYIRDWIGQYLLWEFAPEEQEFSFIDVAREYFQDPPTTVQQAATLFALFEAPHYFRRAGGAKGRFRKAPAEIVQQALAAIEDIDTPTSIECIVAILPKEFVVSSSSE